VPGGEVLGRLPHCGDPVWRLDAASNCPDPKATALAATVAPLPMSPASPPTGERIVLTRRERDVLRLLAEERSDRQIADTLYIGLRTVSWHVSSILSKLDASTRLEAVERASAGFI
jgi:DNA-binding NarL/FixJ family response regulator